MAKYFGTNGVRGRFNELTPDLILKLSMAIGHYIKDTKKNSDRKQTTSQQTISSIKPSSKPTILVARDCRLSGPIIRDLVCSALNSVGADVLDLGIVSAPTAELMVKTLKADACIIITASHNPPEWNALKVIDADGVAISKERGEQIESYLDKLHLNEHLSDWFSIGSTKKYYISTNEHVSLILNFLGSAALEQIAAAKKQSKSKKLKIAFDAANGAACFIAPILFEKLGVEFISINATPDGRFPGRNSEPSEANLTELINCVKDNKLDAGIAWDGDGDRVVFVDETGQYIIGDQVFALSLLWKLNSYEVKESDHNNKSKNPNKTQIVTTVATSKAIEELGNNHGLYTKYTAIGAPYLSEEVAKNKNVLLAGEEVGGVIWPDFSLAKDGFLTAAKLIEALSEKPLSHWLKEVPKYVNVKRKIEAETPERKKQIVEKVRQYVIGKNLKIMTIDGIRIDFKDSWVIVRSSGTENYVRVFAEAKTEGEAKRLADEFEKIAKSQ